MFLAGLVGEVDLAGPWNGFALVRIHGSGFSIFPRIWAVYSSPAVPLSTWQLARFVLKSRHD
jgi:hypothetical protein